MAQQVELRADPEVTSLVQSEDAAILSMIERAARDQNVDIDKMERLMRMRLQMSEQAARRAFNQAIASAKAEIEPVVRNKAGHNNKRYADFSAIARTVDPVISKHGLSYRFRTAQADRISVTCVLSHTDGHSEETTLSGPADASGSKNAIQAIGSTLTYLQRYSLVQALGLAAADDDDGKASGGPETISPEQAEQLQSLIIESGADPVKFMEVGKISNLAEMMAADFEPAMAMLRRRAAKGAK